VPVVPTPTQNTPQSQASKPDASINWPQVGNGVIDVLVGIVTIAGSGSAIAASNGTASPFLGTLFTEGVISLGYGICEIGNGLLGGATMPSSLDAFFIFTTGGRAGTLGSN
jgi:hypothetical protein